MYVKIYNPIHSVLILSIHVCINNLCKEGSVIVNYLYSKLYILHVIFKSQIYIFHTTWDLSALDLL